MTFKLAVAQLNFVVGDMAGNAQKILSAARIAHAQGVSLLLTAELSLCGYPAEDLLLRPSFIQACDESLLRLQEDLAPLQGLSVVVGHPHARHCRKVRDPSGELRSDFFAPSRSQPTLAAGPARDSSLAEKSRSVSSPPCTNRASVLCGGEIVAHYDKQELPNYQVFDERRYFAKGQTASVFEVQGLKVGLLLCEDAWFEGPSQECAKLGAELLVVLNASPFHAGKGAEREQVMAQRVRQTGLPLVYAHLVGGQDEVVFEGRSFALNVLGQVCARAPSFEECLLEIELERATSVATSLEGAMVASDLHPKAAWQLKGHVSESPDALSDLWHALVLGVRDYVNKNGFPGVLLGLSGGIDSALVLALAVDALGPERVRAVMMPSPYTASISLEDAREMARRVGVRYDELSIVPEFEAFKHSLQPLFEGKAEDATEENIQARIRGTMLMALSNKLGAIVLTTGNKSEMATGYCTLYGDMAGGFAVIKDVVKTTVFQLARWRNAHDPLATVSYTIPERIITRPPSAELRADQTDQDSLPPYEVLDAILSRYMEEDQSAEDIVRAGFAPADVALVTRLIRINEYKRRQSPVGIRVTHRSFGKDWRYPITSKFRA
jgi:NAD+ synthase (glutamine-hydrolysing)